MSVESDFIQQPIVLKSVHALCYYKDKSANQHCLLSSAKLKHLLFCICNNSLQDLYMEKLEVYNQQPQLLKN